MSEIMEQGVLRMPPELWTDSPLEQMNRHSRYVSAADDLVRLRSLVEAQDEYIVLLGKELDQVVPIAYAHGWSSTGYEAGVAAREKIAKLTSTDLKSIKA